MRYPSRPRSRRSPEQVVAEAGDTSQAVHFADVFRPDVLVLAAELLPTDDSRRPALRQKVLLSTRLLVLNSSLPAAALAELGIAGALELNASASDLVDAIHALASEHTYFPAESSPTTHEHREAELPTIREIEVLLLVEQGLTNRAIADRLRTRPRTVQFHVSNLFAKLGAHSRTEMIHLARLR